MKMPASLHKTQEAKGLERAQTFPGVLSAGTAQLHASGKPLSLVEPGPYDGADNTFLKKILVRIT